MKKFIVLMLVLIVCSIAFVPSSNAINPDSYSLILQDIYNDYFYFNEINSFRSGYKLYEGKWIATSPEFNCTLMYNESTKEITLCADYIYDQVFFYRLHYKSPNYFYGAFTYLRDKYGNRVRLMDMEITKGSLPGAMPGKTAGRISPADIILQQEGDPNTLKLGALIPLSGELASMGEAFAKTLEVAQEDAQEYLNQSGSELSVELLVEDNQTNPGDSYHRIQDLRAKGVNIFLGPQDSSSVDYMKQFADAEDYLLFSSSSTAIGLSLPNDNVMRCISDDTHQAAALIEQAQDDGITDLYIVSRTDLYGNDFYQALERGFIEKGGAVKTFLYSRPDADIQDTVEALLTAISEQTALNDGKKVGVALIAFDEGIDIMELASTATDAGNVLWYGTDALAQSMAILQNGKAAEFAAQTNFTCTTIGRPQTEAFQAVSDKVTAKLGYTPPTLTLLIYDAYQLAVRAYQKAGTNEVETYKSALAEVAETYQGISGDMSLNANGDRAEGMYDYWTVHAENGQYFWDSDSNWTGEPVSILEWALFE